MIHKNISFYGMVKSDDGKIKNKKEKKRRPLGGPGIN